MLDLPTATLRVPYIHKEDESDIKDIKKIKEENHNIKEIKEEDKNDIKEIEKIKEKEENDIRKIKKIKEEEENNNDIRNSDKTKENKESQDSLTDISKSSLSSTDASEEERYFQKLSSGDEKSSDDDFNVNFEAKIKKDRLISMRKSYASTGNIINSHQSPYDPVMRRSRNFQSRQNLLRSSIERNSFYYSMNSVKGKDDLSYRIRHSNSSLNIPTIEGNSRRVDDIRKLRKTFTSPHISDSNFSIYSDYTSTDTICSSMMSVGSSYSICDSCDNICESIIDLLEKKETRRFTEMENGHLKLIEYKQCPKWLTDNPYIISSYRPPCYSYKACYKSLFYVHNETGNIYTHLIGTVLFTLFYGFTAFQYIPSFKELDSLEITSIIMSVVGGFICMYFSSHFHLFSSHSLKVNRNWLTCDFIGIVSLIYTTGLPLSYYSFYCLPEFRVKYMAVSAIVGAVSLVSMLNPVFSKDEYRLIRSGLFLVLAISELLPIGYAIIFFKKSVLVNYLSLYFVIAGTSMYLLGLILYAKRIPEIYYPGKFDVWGHSHQLFHTLILLASVTFYVGIMKTVRAYNLDPSICTSLF